MILLENIIIRHFAENARRMLSAKTNYYHIVTLTMHSLKTKLLVPSVLNAQEILIAQ